MEDIAGRRIRLWNLESNSQTSDSYIPKEDRLAAWLGMTTVAKMGECVEGRSVCVWGGGCSPKGGDSGLGSESLEARGLLQ